MNKILVMGSGSWGTALVKILLEDSNVQVEWWVRSEESAAYINAKGRNQKYLRSVKFDMSRLRASSDAVSLVKANDIILLVTPSAFISDVMGPIDNSLLAGKKMGTSEFRVRNVPAPGAMLGGIPNNGNAVTKGQLCAQNRVLATLGQDFAYNLQFSVLKYRFIYSPRHGNPEVINGSGDVLTSQMKNLMCRSKRGDRFIIEGITAKDTKYGMVKKVNSMTLTVR
ncbi:hypothetical protein N8368_03365 [Bacteroidia bacterium]|nr:hypothetical protein [Bacteroidia bacterium]